MTNREHLLQDTTTLEYLLDIGDFWGVNIEGNVKLCKRIDCRHCKFNTDRTCACQRQEWLNKEYVEEPLLFPIGTPVEVTKDDSAYMGYYNGFQYGSHYVTHYKQFIGSRYKDGTLYGGMCSADEIRKVGDANA